MYALENRCYRYFHHQKTPVDATSNQASPYCYGGIEGGRPKASAGLQIPDEPGRGDRRAVSSRDAGSPAKPSRNGRGDPVGRPTIKISALSASSVFRFCCTTYLHLHFCLHGEKTPLAGGIPPYTYAIYTVAQKNHKIRGESPLFQAKRNALANESAAKQTGFML